MPEQYQPEPNHHAPVRRKFGGSFSGAEMPFPDHFDTAVALVLFDDESTTNKPIRGALGRRFIDGLGILLRDTEEG